MKEKTLIFFRNLSQNLRSSVLGLGSHSISEMFRRSKSKTWVAVKLNPNREITFTSSFTKVHSK